MVALNSDQAVVSMEHAPEEFGGACSLEECRFCGLQQGRDDLFAELHGETPRLAVPGTPDSLMAMLCAFPIGHSGGHLLIAPRRHYPSLAQFPWTDDLRTLVEAVTQILQQMFPQHWLFVFEHGPGAIENRPVKCGGCHVDHAHGHVLVLDTEVEFDEIRLLTEDTLAALGWNLGLQTRGSKAPFLDIKRFTGNHPYLHIGMLGPERTALTYKQESESQSIPSQLLRKLVATAAGKPQPSYWNWKIALQRNLQSRLQQYTDAALGFKRALEGYLSVGVARA